MDRRNVLLPNGKLVARADNLVRKCTRFRVRVRMRLQVGEQLRDGIGFARFCCKLSARAGCVQCACVVVR